MGEAIKRGFPDKGESSQGTDLWLPVSVYSRLKGEFRLIGNFLLLPSCPDYPEYTVLLLRTEGGEKGRDNQVFFFFFDREKKLSCLHSSIRDNHLEKRQLSSQSKVWESSSCQLELIMCGAGSVCGSSTTRVSLWVVRIGGIRKGLADAASDGSDGWLLLLFYSLLPPPPPLPLLWEKKIMPQSFVLPPLLLQSTFYTCR